MPTGTVKWFNNAKGYGFILPTDSEIDVFAHYSEITMEGYRTLKAGQAVTFELVDGDKGQHAEKIAPLLDPEMAESTEHSSDAEPNTSVEPETAEVES